MVELIVVVAVILLLLSILFPLAGRALEGAKRGKCKQNQKSIIQGAHLYAAENKGHIISARPTSGFVQISFNRPEWERWKDIGFFSEGNNAIGTIVSELTWSCPSRDFVSTYESGYEQINTGYQYFGGIHTWQTPDGPVASNSPVTGNAAPDQALTADTVAKIDGEWGGGRSPAYGDMPVHKGDDPWPDGGNVGYWDGSVNYVKFEKMVKIHSWNWSAREFYWYQEDLGDYVPVESSYGRNNMF